MELIEYKHVLQNKKTYTQKNDAPAYIYFLVKENVIVYVGQTTNLRNRLQMHRLDKDFDSYHHIETTSIKVKGLEMQYIDKFKPEYNKNFYGYDYITLEALQKEFNLDAALISCVLSKLKMWDERYPTQMAQTLLTDYKQRELEKTEEFKKVKEEKKIRRDLEMKRKIEEIFEDTI